MVDEDEEAAKKQDKRYRRGAWEEKEKLRRT